MLLDKQYYQPHALEVEVIGLANGMNSERREDPRTVLTVLASAIKNVRHLLRWGRLEESSGLRIIKASV